MSTCRLKCNKGTVFNNADIGLYIFALSPKSPPTFNNCKPNCFVLKNLP